MGDIGVGITTVLFHPILKVVLMNLEVVVLDGNGNTQIKEELLIGHADGHGGCGHAGGNRVAFHNAKETVVNKFSIAHFVRNDQLPHRAVVHIFANIVREELDGVVVRFHHQRVNDLDVQRTIVVLVLDVVIDIVCKNQLTGLIRHVKEQTTVTLTLNTSNHRNVAILRVEKLLNRFMRNTNIPVDVTTTGKIRSGLTVEVVSVKTEMLVLIVTVGQDHEVVLLMVDKNLVSTSSELVLRDSEGVGDTLVAAVDHFRSNGSTESVIIDPVDQLAGIVLNIALGDKKGLAGVLQIRDTHIGVSQLVDLVAFELIGTLLRGQGIQRLNRNSGNRHNRVRLTIGSVSKHSVILVDIRGRGQCFGNLGIQLLVGLVIVISHRVVVGNEENQLVLQLSDGDIGSVRTVKGLEAVFEQ